MSVSAPKAFRHILAALTICLGAALGADDKVEEGQMFPAIKGEDQYGEPHSVEAVRHVLVSFDMKTGKQANAYLAQQDQSYLPEHNAVYIANIHGMPGVGRFFALRKMRKYPHRILLVDDISLLGSLPQREQHITVFTLDDRGRVEDVSYWEPNSGESPFGAAS